jgi:hypothetical protein
MIYRGVSPMPDVPTVDFAKHMVLVVALGTKPTGGYQILLDSAVRTTTGLTVYVRTVPPGSASAAAVITHPVDVGVVPKSDGAVTFLDAAS